MVVDCPVVANRSGANPAESFDLWYIDNSPSSISCTFLSEDHDSVAFTAATLSTTRDDNLYAALTFSSTTFSEGYSHFRCVIPTRDSAGNASYIVGYAGW